jgi:hypothetical protein
MASSRLHKAILALTIAFTLGVGFQADPGVSATPYDTRLVINIPSRTLWVYSGEQIIKYFPVGVGRPGFMTPVGQFSVLRKIVDPGWEHPYQAKGSAVRIAPGETNPLGTRWIGFYQKGGGEYGMHGTDNPGSVGKFSSHGCVRMKIPDAEKLFEMVEVGTPVEVVYQPVLIRRNGNDIRLLVYRDVFRKGMPSVQKVQADILKQYPNAQVDPVLIEAAIRQATEKPFVVGQAAAPTSEEPLAAKTIVKPSGALPLDSQVLGPLPATKKY